MYMYTQHTFTAAYKLQCESRCPGISELTLTLTAKDKFDSTQKISTLNPEQFNEI